MKKSESEKAVDPEVALVGKPDGEATLIKLDVVTVVSMFQEILELLVKLDMRLEQADKDADKKKSWRGEVSRKSN